MTNQKTLKKKPSDFSNNNGPTNRGWSARAQVKHEGALVCGKA